MESPTDGRPEHSIDLEALAASEVAAHLGEKPVASTLEIDSSSKLCPILELLIPSELGRVFPEWEAESIDGFFFSSAVKSGEGSAALAGTCILISDQTLTPFSLKMSLAPSDGFEVFRIRMGEAGSGPLGISGPKHGSPEARELLSSLNPRLRTIDWKYELNLKW